MKRHQQGEEDIDLNKNTKNYHQVTAVQSVKVTPKKPQKISKLSSITSQSQSRKEGHQSRAITSPNITNKQSFDFKMKKKSNKFKKTPFALPSQRSSLSIQKVSGERGRGREMEDSIDFRHFQSENLMGSTQSKKLTSLLRSRQPSKNRYQARKLRGQCNLVKPYRLTSLTKGKIFIPILNQGDGMPVPLKVVNSYLRKPIGEDPKNSVLSKLENEYQQSPSKKYQLLSYQEQKQQSKYGQNQSSIRLKKGASRRKRRANISVVNGAK